MKNKIILCRFIKVTLFIGGILVMSGCILKLIIPAPERNFLPQDLLLTTGDLPSQWSVAFGPQKVGDNTKPSNSTEIALLKSTDIELTRDEKWDVMERVYRFNSIEGAKEDYATITTFPGETNIEGWTFLSSLANEQKFSCYTYSNMEFPVCRWIARYEEIVIEVIGWLDPNRITLEDFQSLVFTIDSKAISNFEKR
jgi:hypothetical protein